MANTKHIQRIILIIVAIICFYLFYSLYLKQSSIKLNIEWKAFSSKPEETMCLKFIQTEMSGDQGIFTNFLDDYKVNEWATGHQVLSESEGLIMLYAVQGGNKSLFDEHFNIVRNMILDNGVIMWRVGSGGELLTKSSASVDDLRIVRSLIYASDRWQDMQYKTFLNELARKVKKYEFTKEGLVDYYDAESKMKADTITLSYIDLYTMKLLSQIDSDWENAFEKGLKIIDDAFISQDKPFFRKTYSYKTKSYSKEQEINIIDYLNILLHLSEVGMCPPEAIDWLKGQIRMNNALFNSYRINSAQPVSDLQCAASYAIACRIAKNVKDKELYEMMKARLLMFQIRDKTSPICGAFGDPTTLKVYSFDNLQALLALQGFGGVK